VPVFFHTGSALGIHPSELSPLERYPSCYHSDEPTYRFTWRCSRRRSGGPAQQAPVPGFRPFRESLVVGRGFSPSSTGCSRGFRPSRVSRRPPRSGFRPNSSLALPRVRRLLAGAAGAPEYHSADDSPDPLDAPEGTPNGSGNPSRVPAPTRSRTLWRMSFRAICSPRAKARITANP
jgi:hypothetical protein